MHALEEFILLHIQKSKRVMLQTASQYKRPH